AAAAAGATTASAAARAAREAATLRAVVFVDRDGRGIAAPPREWHGAKAAFYRLRRGLSRNPGPPGFDTLHRMASNARNAATDPGDRQAVGHPPGSRPGRPQVRLPDGDRLPRPGGDPASRAGGTGARRR